MLPFSRSKRKFRFKSARFYGAEVELPFNAGAGRKLHCENRGEIARYFPPHASIWLVLAQFPPLPLLLEDPKGDLAELLLPLGLVLAR
jgi:hypothetical protein